MWSGSHSIPITSGNGGTGKTIIMANLGMELGALGKDVMLLDGDLFMANLALVMGMRKCELSFSTHCRVWQKLTRLSTKTTA